MTHYKKIASSNPNWLEFWTFQGISSHNTEKGSRIVKSDMASEKNMRMEEIGKGQQEMKEKIARMADMVTSLTKEKGITDDPSLQESLRLGKMASIYLLCQIWTTFVDKKN